MDLSKLPRMSQTPPRDQPPPRPAGDSEYAAPVHGQEHDPRLLYGAPVPATNVRVEAGLGAEVWLSAIFGLIFLLLGMRFARWLIVTAAGGTFDTGIKWMSGPNAGQPVSYFELQGYPALTEMGFFLFGLALILEAIALLTTASAGLGVRKAAVTVALAVTLLATAVNLGVSGYLASFGLIPIWSLIIVAFGGYMCFYLFRMLQVLRLLQNAGAG